MSLAIIFYNNSINSTTKYKPVELFFGHYNEIALEETTKITSNIVDEYKSKIKRLNKKIANDVQVRKEKNIDKQNKKRLGKEIKIGQQIYIKFPGKYSKTNPIAKGPFIITEILEHNKIKVKNKNGKNFEYHINSIKSVVTDSSASES